MWHKECIVMHLCICALPKKKWRITFITVVGKENNVTHEENEL